MLCEFPTNLDSLKLIDADHMSLMAPRHTREARANFLKHKKAAGYE